MEAKEGWDRGGKRGQSRRRAARRWYEPALEPLASVRGVESLLLISGPGQWDSWGVESPEEFAAWTQRVLKDFQDLGGLLNVGPLRSVEAVGSVRGVVLLTDGGRELMAGLDRRISPTLVRAAGKELATYLGQQ